jgi:methyl-accepting chemotaxis protein
MDNSKKTGKTQGITVGAKILLGVALASNIIIGSMLYINLQANATVERIVNDVLVMREDLSDNLRKTIVDLQNEFLTLPALFRSNDRNAVLDLVNHDFQTVGEEVLTGRENYQQHYSRQERRDLANKGFVIQSTDDGLLLSYGILDAAGAFTDTVERRHLASANPDQDAVRLAATIASLSEQTVSPGELRQRIRELYRKSADIGLKAELTRNEILYNVDEISAKERQLAETRTKQRHITLSMGVMAILANMVILFFLVRLIVERPLHHLAQSIEEIRSGNFAEVPCLNRRDQIGVLSEGISHFREVLIGLQSENLRKTREKSVVDELIDTIAGVIHTLEGRARELVAMSTRLSEQAAVVEVQSGSVPLYRGVTADHATGLSEPPEPRTAARDGAGQIEARETVAQEILDRSNNSRAILGRIITSIGEINDTITVVREIAEQTKFLAMNATIQAERGGDASRKLGTFANEIWELSFNTDQAAKIAMARVENIEKENTTLTSTLQGIDSRILDLKHITDIPLVVPSRQAETGVSAGPVDQAMSKTGAVPADIDEAYTAVARSRDLSRQVCRQANEIAAQLASLLHETTTRLHQMGRKEDMPQLATFTLALDQAGGKV